MTYDPTVPAINTRIDATYNIVQNNFDQANTIFGVDHYEFDYSDPALRGLHIQTTFASLPNGPVPAPTPPLGFGAAYAKSVTSGSPSKTTTYPFYRRDGFTTDYPVIPIKAFCTFITRNTNGAATIVNSFNITSVTRTANTGQYVVVFTQPLPYEIGVTEYSALFGVGGPPLNAVGYYLDIETAASPGVTITGDSFTLQLRNSLTAGAFDSAGNRMSFAILQ